MAALTKEIVRSDGVRLRQVVDGGRVTSTSYLSPDGTWQQGMPQAKPGTTWTQANGDHVSIGPDGQGLVNQAPHGIMDRIAQVAPYGIMAGMGYGALSDAGAFGAAAGSSGGGAASAGASSPGWWGVGASSATGGGSGAGAASAAAAAGSGATKAATKGGVGGVLSKIWGTISDHPGLVTGGLAVGGDLLAAKLAADAANHAADIQGQYLNRALDFEQGRYKDAQGNFQPYITTGQNALSTLSSRLANQPSTDALYAQFAGPLVQNAQNNGSRTVTMQAPSGETKAVPDFMVPHYSAAGAKVTS